MAKTLYSYIYNGHVCRNSNRIYEYGLVNHCGGVIACSSTEKGALKVKTQELSRLEHNLDYYMKKGKQDYADLVKQDIENVKQWHTVKLERREN